MSSRPANRVRLNSDTNAVDPSMLRELINSIDQKLKKKRMSVREAVIATKRLNVQLQTERKLEARGWTHILAQQHLDILDVMLCALTSWTSNETVSMG